MEKSSFIVVVVVYFSFVCFLVFGIVCLLKE